MGLSWEPGPLSCCRGWALRIVAHGLPGNVTLPGPGIETVFPALAGRFLTPGPPGKSLTLTIFQGQIRSIRHHHTAVRPLPEPSRLPSRRLCAISSYLPHFPWALTPPPSSVCVRPLLQYPHRITQRLSFCVWLISVSIRSSRFPRATAGVKASFPSLSDSKLCGWTTRCSSTTCRGTFGLLPPFFKYSKNLIYSFFELLAVPCSVWDLSFRARD